MVRTRITLLAISAASALGSLALPGSASGDPFVYVTGLAQPAVAQYAIGAGGALSPLMPPTVSVGVGALGVAPAPDGNSVYMVSFDGATSLVSQFDVNASTGVLTPKDPAAIVVPDGWKIAVSPDGRSAYVTAIGIGRVLQFTIDPATGTLSPKQPASVAAGGPNAFPFDVAVAPGGGSVYVTTFNADVLQYDVDPATGALTPKAPASVPAGDTSEGIAVSSDGKSVYVANINDGTVSQYDVATGGALSPKNPATVPSGRGPTDVALTPDGRSAYVYDSGIGGGAPPVDAVSQYNVNAANGTLSPKSPATVAARSGSTASELAASPDGRSLYVVNGALVSQYTIDPSAGTLTPKSPSTVPNAGDGIGIAIASPRSFPTSKDQCKKGGWRNFGMFRNQGDCVSFVATGGKKKPKG